MTLKTPNLFLKDCKKINATHYTGQAMLTRASNKPIVSVVQVIVIKGHKQQNTLSCVLCPGHPNLIRVNTKKIFFKKHNFNILKTLFIQDHKGFFYLLKVF